jgi:release factor glutamine methyltransferase
VNAAEALREGTRLLRSIGSDEARLEAELLLMHALKTDRVHLYQATRRPLTPDEGEAYSRLLKRRQAHEPTPYVIGHKEFYGLDFDVSRAALIPRPETETLVDLAIEFARRSHAETITIADVGTGSGIIAVSLAYRLLNARIIATETSKRALTLARRNAERHGVISRIDFRHGDMLATLGTKVDIIAANLPYVTTDDWSALPPEIREYEPKGALEAGRDGLRYIRRLLRQAPDRLVPDGAIFAEIGENQGAAARFRARRAFPEANLEVARDLAGRDRVLCVYT